MAAQDTHTKLEFQLNDILILIPVQFCADPGIF